MSQEVRKDHLIHQMSQRRRLRRHIRYDRLQLVLLGKHEDPVLPPLGILPAHLRAQSRRLDELALANQVLNIAQIGRAHV